MTTPIIHCGRVRLNLLTEKPATQEAGRYDREDCFLDSFIVFLLGLDSIFLLTGILSRLDAINNRQLITHLYSSIAIRDLLFGDLCAHLWRISSNDFDDRGF